MRARIAISILLGLILTASLIAPAQAITSEANDGNAHPMVGALLRPTREEEGLGGSRATCSGTLVETTEDAESEVFLTAAHCPFAEGDAVYVSFDNPFLLTDEPSEQGIEGIFHRHQKFVSSVKYDVAVVLLDPEDVDVSDRATLPTLGFLGTQALSGTKFLSVGYGVDYPWSGSGGGPSFVQSGDRKVATSTFKSLTSSTLTLAQKLAKEDSGTCAGDSGGPTFMGTSMSNKMLVSISITGDTYCKSTNVTNRMDTQISRDFLAGFDVELP